MKKPIGINHHTAARNCIAVFFTSYSPTACVCKMAFFGVWLCAVQLSVATVLQKMPDYRCNQTLCLVTKVLFARRHEACQNHGGILIDATTANGNQTLYSLVEYNFPVLSKQCEHFYWSNSQKSAKHCHAFKFSRQSTTSVFSAPCHNRMCIMCKLPDVESTSTTTPPGSEQDLEQTQIIAQPSTTTMLSTNITRTRSELPDQDTELQQQRAPVATTTSSWLYLIPFLFAAVALFVVLCVFAALNFLKDANRSYGNQARTT